MARIVLLVIALSLVLAAPAHARAVSVTTLRPTVDTGPATLLVAAEMRSTNRLRIVVLRVDDKPDDEAYVLALSAGACKTGPELLRIKVKDRTVVDVNRRIPREAIGGRLQWGVRDIGERQSKTTKCRNAGPLSRRGMIISPRDPASGQATGVFALRLSRQDIVQVTSLMEEEGIFYFGASRRECDDSAFTATDDLWQWRRLKADGNEVAIETLELWNSVQTRSFATVAKDAPPGLPHSCAKWELSELDA